MLTKFAKNVRTGLKELGGMIKDVVDETPPTISGTITFRIYFCFPVWESSLPRNPTTFCRKLTIHAAKNLPDVNDSPPSCKVVILYSGTIIGTSMVITHSSFPVWPETDCNLSVGFDSIIPVVIQVITQFLLILKMLDNFEYIDFSC